MFYDSAIAEHTRSTPALVLVHGGHHAGDCWDLTVAELRRQAPDLRVLVIDLPGHGAKPGDLATDTIDDLVASAVADVEAAALGELIIAGHSMAGLTVPGIVTKLGSTRVRELILIAGSVPPEGKAMVDILSGPIALYARRSARSGRPVNMPRTLARWAFCNGMTREQKAFTLSHLRPESSLMAVHSVDRTGLPEDVPRTWILTLRDRVLSQHAQRGYIASLGGVETIIPIDACHEAMISEPRLLTEILIERVRLHA